MSDYLQVLSNCPQSTNDQAFLSFKRKPQFDVETVPSIFAQEYSCRVSRDGLLVERRTRDRKVVSSNPGRSGGRIFFSSVNFV